MPGSCCFEAALGLSVASLAVWLGHGQSSEATSRESKGAAPSSSAEQQPGSPSQAVAKACEALASQLPRGRPRVCILGGTAFKDPDSELLVKALAKFFARNLSSSVVVLTGGMSGVQETFARSVGVEARRWSGSGSTSPSSTQTDIINLLPAGQSSGYGVGRDLEAGADLEERKQIFAQLGHIYLTIEGGPGVAQEASTAFERGAVVLPISSTGGASSGLFGFPAGALERPAYAPEDQWETLQRKGDPDETALAVVQIIWTLISKDGVVGKQVGTGSVE